MGARGRVLARTPPVRGRGCAGRRRRRAVRADEATAAQRRPPGAGLPGVSRGVPTGPRGREGPAHPRVRARLHGQRGHADPRAGARDRSRRVQAHADRALLEPRGTRHDRTTVRRELGPHPEVSASRRPPAARDRRRDQALRSRAGELGALRRGRRRAGRADRSGRSAQGPPHGARAATARGPRRLHLQPRAVRGPGGRWALRRCLPGRIEIAARAGGASDPRVHCRRGDVLMAEIELQKVTKRYPDGTEAVKAVDLEIGDGEFMILVGPSGCGKSTALRMIAGLEDITEGELIIGGERVNELGPRERDIAMVFQNYALYPHMTVRDNMGFALKLSKTERGEIDRKVTEAARILDLEQHLERKPANLSGGQRQRVAMGRAIVRDPKAFLMDEPLSNLDAKLRVQMRTEVARIQKRLGTTMVYVTHDQTEAMTLGDRVAVMRAGIIQQVDTPANLYENPQNLFVAGFIGSPSMNFLPGRIEGDVVKTPIGDVPLSDQNRRGVQQAGSGRDVIVGMRPEHFEDAAVE